ncbi:hypothetical protein DFP74_2706 [Nocardiopsis sp. Huas11]|uniref:hypothetical protein n=1 Tax=Nocardiopsis sp. Huas11 TaxID=2183912 RepID=UPI000F2D928E|nr:hypothetical protein [Nocardiopsis sp. Huas11]RKS07052.1 hypothetical protein DFP74_2706 [Nocardiopsis sp. Huas11]
MTHTHHGTDRGRPPLAVWPCAPQAHQPPYPGAGETLPERLTHRLVTEYTRPGQVVADLTGTSVVAAQAEAAGRTCEAGTRTFPEQGEVQVSGVAWADLVATAVPAHAAHAEQVRHRRLRARLGFAATIARPGGIVAVITPLGHTPEGAVVDPAPGVVRAATCAGLVYLQHVIALMAPICEAGLGATIPVREAGIDLDPDPEEVDTGLPASVADAAATITSPAHLNVSVFRLPRRGRSATAATRGEVGA